MAVFLSLELVRRLDHHIRRAGDEIVRLQQPIDRSLGGKVLSLIGKAHRQFSRGQLGKLQRQIDDLAADIVGNPIPNAVRSGTVVN